MAYSYLSLKEKHYIIKQNKGKSFFMGADDGDGWGHLYKPQFLMDCKTCSILVVYILISF